MIRGSVPRIVALVLILIFLTTSLYSQQPTVALVLSGGGARGVAHIAVIEKLEEIGIPIDMVLGTSMGAFVGALYAAGYSPSDMREFVQSIDVLDMFAVTVNPIEISDPVPLKFYRDNLFMLNFGGGGLGSGPGIVGDQNIVHLLNNLFVNVSSITDFDELEIPFRAVAADAITGKKVLFSHGSLVSAVRASISIPLVFTPYLVDGRYYVDGGIVDNLPILEARKLGADIIIAVDVNTTSTEKQSEDIESLSHMLEHVVDVITLHTVAHQLKESDLLITPTGGDYNSLSFTNLDKFLQIGKEAVEQSHQQLQDLADHIALVRPLEVKDPTRRGSYFDREDIIIRKIRTDHSFVEGYDLHRLSFLLSRPFTSQQRALLKREADEIRDRYYISTVHYTIEDVIQTDGNLTYGDVVLKSQRYTPKTSTLSGSLFGATSVTFSPYHATQISHRPDFAFNYTNYNVFNQPIRLRVSLSNDDALRVASSIDNTWKQRWRVGFEGEFLTGGIHPLNLRTTLRGVKERDRLIGASVYAEHRIRKEYALRLQAEREYMWFGQGDSLFYKPLFSVSIGGVYTTLPITFFPTRGIRADLRAKLEFPFFKRYQAEAQFQAAIPLGMRDTLLFHAKGGFSHGMTPKKDAFFDYGGIQGIPTYGGGSYVDELVMGKITYLHWFRTGSISTLLHSMLSGGIRGASVNEIFEHDLFERNEAPMFSSLHAFDLSASVAFGFKFERMDLLIGFAVDLNAQVSLFIEVL